MVEKGGLNFIQYGRLGSGVKAFTTTRCGLAKSGCNLYKAYDLANGRESFRKVCAVLGVNPGSIATNRLIQQTNIVREVAAAEPDIYDEPAIVRADGLITQSNRVVLYLYASDCAIVFLHDLEHRAIGFCHAGWRGTVRGIIQNTVCAMQDSYGTKPENLMAAISPMVSQSFCGLTASEAQEFDKADLGHFVSYWPGRYAGLRKKRDDQSPWPPEVPDYYADLLGADLLIMQRAGLRLENIETTNLCTYERADLFHSYFRGPIDAEGRHLNGVNGSLFWLE